MRVTIPSPLLSYSGRHEVQAIGATAAEALLDLDRQFPGIRFRMVDEQGQVRTHMRLFLNGAELHDLGMAVDDKSTLHIVQALSGG